MPAIQFQVNMHDNFLFVNLEIHQSEGHQHIVYGQRSKYFFKISIPSILQKHDSEYQGLKGLFWITECSHIENHVLSSTLCVQLTMFFLPGTSAPVRASDCISIMQ